MENTNVQLIPVNLNKSVLDNADIHNGAVYFVQDTQELFYDFDSKRTQVKDIIILETENDRTSSLFNPVNKFYFVMDTQVLWLYNDEQWYQVTKDLDGYYDKVSLNNLLTAKQDKLTAGTNIKIEDNVISCSVDSLCENDDITITLNEQSKLQTIGVKTLNDIIKFDWIGTLAEYEADLAKGIITDTTVCFVTDD